MQNTEKRIWNLEGNGAEKSNTIVELKMTEKAFFPAFPHFSPCASVLL